MDNADGNGFPDRGPPVFAVTVATLVLASVFVAARIVCRYFIVRNFAWDDRVMVLAWLLAVFLSFTICLGTAHGLGRYDENIDRADRPVLRRCEYVFSILYVCVSIISLCPPLLIASRSNTIDNKKEPSPHGH
jgi:uncharacterized membrane protein (DUF4010 family)